MSKGNCRANGISERESNNQPDCKDDQDISHTSTEFLVSVDALNKKPELDYDYQFEKAGSPRLSSHLYSMIEYELRHMRNGDEKWSQTGSTGSGSVFCVRSSVETEWAASTRMQKSP